MYAIGAFARPNRRAIPSLVQWNCKRRFGIVGYDEVGRYGICCSGRKWA